MFSACLYRLPLPVCVGLSWSICEWNFQKPLSHSQSIWRSDGMKAGVALHVQKSTYTHFCWLQSSFYVMLVVAFVLPPILVLLLFFQVSHFTFHLLSSFNWSIWSCCALGQFVLHCVSRYGDSVWVCVCTYDSFRLEVQITLLTGTNHSLCPVKVTEHTVLFVFLTISVIQFILPSKIFWPCDVYDLYNLFRIYMTL